MKNFVLFLNSCFISSALFIFSFFKIILVKIIEDKQVDSEELGSLYGYLILMFIGGCVAGILNMLLVLYIPFCFLVWQKYNHTLYGTVITLRSYEFIFYMFGIFIFGASFATSVAYFYLNMQGFTRKEKHSVLKKHAH